MKYGDVSFSIEVGKDALEEYEITVNEETKELTCWIPSEVGAVRDSAFFLPLTLTSCYTF